MTGETIGLMVSGVCAGVAATLTMDVLGIAAQRIGLIAGAKGAWVGRWYLGMLRGKFIHENIAVAPEQHGEKWAALAGHYVIGIVLAILYLLGAGWLGFSPGSLLPAIGYGLVTCVFPLLLVYPALGFGACGLNGPPELKLFISSLVNHSFYGVGLWWAVKVLPLG